MKRYNKCEQRWVEQDKTALAQVVREKLRYDPETGHFFWLVFGKGIKRDRAGCLAPNGHRYIGVSGRRILESHLAWLFIYGDWPEEEVDHVNQNPSDNRAVNLRAAGRSLNNANKHVRRDSSSGIKGVYQLPKGNWCAYLVYAGKKKHLGVFATWQEASAAYAKAAQATFGEFACVR
jgi:hypothetical protein